MIRRVIAMPENPADGRRLILASTSPFRRELLARLGLPFSTQAPDADESRQSGEDASALVARWRNSRPGWSLATNRRR